MVINLLTPFWGSLFSGLLILIIAGTYHYIVTLVKFNLTDKKLSNVLSELDMLKKNYEKEVPDINKRDNKEIINNITMNINTILEHNKLPIRMTLRQALSGYENIKTK